jgi:O-6-methylguanine DNA methyltransferase
VKQEKEYRYGSVQSEFGEIVVVWRFTGNKIVRVFLPRQKDLFKSSQYNIRGVKVVSDRSAAATLRKIELMSAGRSVALHLDTLDWEMTYPFQNRVLRMERMIPLGRVSTYGRLAQKLGKPGAARAVGNALASNPFPLIIPCHRAVRSDGSLGGYAGGISMKRKLLESEGIEFDEHDRVITGSFL